MGYVAPIVGLAVDIGNAVATGYSIYETGKQLINGAPSPSQSVVASPSQSAHEQFAQSAENFKNGLQGYIRSLAAESPLYIERYKPQIEDQYRSAVEYHQAEKDSLPNY
jgi:hypothetical protein